MIPCAIRLRFGITFIDVLCSSTFETLRFAMSRDKKAIHSLYGECRLAAPNRKSQISESTNQVPSTLKRIYITLVARCLSPRFARLQAARRQKDAFLQHKTVIFCDRKMKGFETQFSECSLERSRTTKHYTCAGFSAREPPSTTSVQV